jgi:hypothetical protein
MPIPNARWTNTNAHPTTTAKAPTIARQPGAEEGPPSRADVANGHPRIGSTSPG